MFETVMGRYSKLKAFLFNLKIPFKNVIDFY